MHKKNRKLEYTFGYHDEEYSFDFEYLFCKGFLNENSENKL